jgi:septal ring factor EnvC (AmiA/AmiB activator)
MDPNSDCPSEETAASAVQPRLPAAESAPSKRRRRRRTAIFLSVGSGLLSVVGFGALTLFEQYNSLVSEMRNDLKHFNETSGEYVKRDSFQRFRDQVKEHLIKELPEVNLAKYRLEQELKASEKARMETAEDLRRLRERLAYLEGRQSTAANPPPASLPNAN